MGAGDEHVEQHRHHAEVTNDRRQDERIDAESKHVAVRGEVVAEHGELERAVVDLRLPAVAEALRLGPRAQGLVDERGYGHGAVGVDVDAWPSRSFGPPRNAARRPLSPSR